MSPPVIQVDDLFWLRDDERKAEAVLQHLREENAHTDAALGHTVARQQALYEELKSHLKETDDGPAKPHGPYDYFVRTVEGLAYRIHCRRPRQGAPKSAPATTPAPAPASAPTTAPATAPASAPASASPSAPAAEEVLLDENQVAAPHAFCSTGAVRPSPSHRLLAYSVDTVGYETYEIRFKDLTTGEPLADVIPDTDSDVVWGADDDEVFYTRMDSAHRPFELWRHRLGTPVDSDTLLLREPDERFWLAVHRSASAEFVFAELASKETSEVHAIKIGRRAPAEGQASKPTAGGGDVAAGDGESDVDGGLGRAVCIAPRQQGVLYSVEHLAAPAPRDGATAEDAGRFLILTNRGGSKNFELLSARCSAPHEWQPLAAFPYVATRNLDGVRPFRDWIAVFGREDGMSQVWVLPGAAVNGDVGADAAAADVHCISFSEGAYEVHEAASGDYDTTDLRLRYSSLVTPPTTLAYDMATRERAVVKALEIPGYTPSLYATERMHATASDGTRIPISLLYRPDLWQPRSSGEPAPMLLQGYGSYGISYDPSFDAKLLPIVDRGVCFAIAHVRGGGEMGRAWYEDGGKYLTKRNTFTDFIACAKHLQAEGLTAPDRLAISGRSAGGLLIGAVLNMAPELFRAAIAGVPFVDTMVSMCDPSIPLTVTEWEEWGNPNEAKYYEYMLSYSPMENIVPTALPALLVTAGLYDPRVAYWEPAKWVARLRAARTNDAPLLLKMDMDSGHFSASDRYKYLRQTALEYAFLLDQLDLLDREVPVLETTNSES